MNSALRIINNALNFSTKGEIEFIDLSDRIGKLVTDSRITNGFVHVFAPHATGIIILTENDSPLLDDIKNFLNEIFPHR